MWVLGSNRRTDSISDILASFPPPLPGAGGTARSGWNGSRASAWPLPSDFMDGNCNGNSEDSSVQTTSKKGRKVCGLPLWAFILLVILALVIISAAVIVPLQLVTLSRNRSSTNSDADILQQCKTKNPCANGGENVATKDFCGCVCTGGFSGKTCNTLDSSCVTMDLEEIKSLGDTFAGIQNATMGSAIKRLLGISRAKYNVQLDGSKVLSAFWASEVSCTAQNALVTFNGKTAPDNATISTTTISSIIPTTTPAPTKRRVKRLTESPSDGPLIYDIGATTQDPPIIPVSVPSTTTPAGANTTASPGNRTLDENVVDFSRVVVLFLVQDKGLKVAVTAQENLQSIFTEGIDHGNVDVGNQMSVDLDKEVLKLPGGTTVGGA